MTADVPLGEARAAGNGIVTLAQLSGRPIIPIAAATSRFIALKTWSKMTINLPFSRLAFVAGPALFVPANATEQMLEQARREVEQALNAVTSRVYEIARASRSHAVRTGRRSPPQRYQ